jgi:glycolate oxidase FAD binding subunit
VKNVAGYDLTKLYCGSFGTLGLVTELIVRLHPAPAEAAWLTLEIDAGRVGELARELARHTGALPACFELDWGADAEAPRGWLRLEGAGAPLRSEVASCRALLSRYGEVAELAARADLAAASPPGGPAWMSCRLSVPPSRLQAELSELRRLAGTLGVRCALAGRAANAVVDASCTAAGEDALAELVAAVRRRLAGRSGATGGSSAATAVRARAAGGDRSGAAAGGSFVVRDAPLSLRRRVEVWGPVAPGTLALMRRVKERFDPGAVLAPGRFVGGI